MAGLEPARPFGLRIFLPATAFAAREKFDFFTVWGLDDAFTMNRHEVRVVRREPSRLYTLPPKSVADFGGLSSALPFLFPKDGFTEFDSIHARVSYSRAQIV